MALSEKHAAICLARTEQVGPVTYRELLEHFGTAKDALDALPELSKRGGRKRPLKPMRESALRKEIDMVEKLGGDYIIQSDGDYPPQLASLTDAPPVLIAFGHKSLLKRKCVGFVGARNASHAALKITETLAHDCGQRDIVSVSGLARGVDTAAHKATLKTGTIAVIANGFDKPYPKENTELQAQIAETNLVLCENPPGTEPQASLFPRRNRIISGLSLGVVIVEAAAKSGSLITARFAAEQGREVMAVPGAALDPRCDGTNDLIRDGVRPVRTVEHIMEDIAPLLDRGFDAPSKPDSLTPATRLNRDVTDTERQKIIDLLGPTPITIDELTMRSELPPQAIYLIIIELELAGRVLREPPHGITMLPE